MKSMNMTAKAAGERAVSVIGYGYDLSSDIRLSYCKPGVGGKKLIVLDEGLQKEIVLPGGVVVKDVSKSIKCDKGERTRFRSDVVTFHQMSEQVNKELSLTGKIPSGFFNAMFNFVGSWQKEAASTKMLAYDGWFITLYNIELARTQITLSDHVKQEVPSSWDPAVLAGFIEKYGTHVIVGVKMGGRDVVHLKQQQSSTLSPNEVQKMLKKLADEKFSENANSNYNLNSDGISRKRKDDRSVAWEQNVTFAKARSVIVSHSKEDMESIYIRLGGIDTDQSHNQWLSTITQSPDLISMSLVPITSLLSGVPGSGFLSHAVNLYLRYKPPIEELHQFLEFQLPRQWAPVYGDLPLGPHRRKYGSPSLQFTFMGLKLFVNTVQVESGNRPVTGIRLYLEGKKGDHLAVHLQHLSMLPKILQLSQDSSCNSNEIIPHQKGYYEPVKWSLFSHVCTAPIEYVNSQIDDSATIVTKAWLDVKDVGMKKVLFLRLGYSMVSSAKIRRSEWDGSTNPSRKSGAISTLISTKFSMGQAPLPPKPVKVEVNSALFPGGPPASTRIPKASKFVDTKEMVRGPEDLPGYWVVTGAKLCVEAGKISLKVKYSLLIIVSDDEEYLN